MLDQPRSTLIFDESKCTALFSEGWRKARESLNYYEMMQMQVILMFLHGQKLTRKHTIF